MASRLGLARIIDWGRACDREELAYVLVRLAKISQERNDRERETLLPGKPKRTRKVKGPNQADIQLHEDAQAAQGVHE